MPTGSMRASLNAWFTANVEKLTDGLAEVAIDASEAGDNITTHHIETRGTAKSGKRGRIESGQMINAVSHGTVSRKRDEITTRFGYKDAPPWTPFQEDGFEHLGGVTVEGMYALVDAAEEVKQDFIRDVEGVLKSV